MPKITLRVSSATKDELKKNFEKANFKSLSSFLIFVSINADAKKKPFLKQCVWVDDGIKDDTIQFRVTEDEKTIIEDKRKEFSFQDTSEYMIYCGLYAKVYTLI